MPEMPSLFVQILKNVLKIDAEQPQEPSIRFRDEPGDISDNRRILLDEGMPSPVPTGEEEMECPECGGAGSSGPGEGYDSTCQRCNGYGKISA